jgi:hypothetical protein
MRTLLIRGHLADELFEDHLGENLVALGRDDGGARAADHLASEIALEIRFQRIADKLNKEGVPSNRGGRWC